jgi:hypothetical protein
VLFGVKCNLLGVFPMKGKILLAAVYLSFRAQGLDAFMVEFNKLSDCQQVQARIFPNNNTYSVYWTAIYPQECK